LYYFCNYKILLKPKPPSRLNSRSGKNNEFLPPPKTPELKGSEKQKWEILSRELA